VTIRQGNEDIQRSLDDQSLEQIAGEAAHGEFLLDAARKAVASAKMIAEFDPVSAFEVVYTAARHSATALLIQQGLRPTTQGGHQAVCDVARAQFGDSYDFLNEMRILRNSLEYPRGPGSLKIQTNVVSKAITYTEDLIAKSEKALPVLTIWRPL
jgi:uncharacterized protein (UPF0332 family)